MDYKDTLNMPQTDFEMRGNLVQKEPIFRQKWLDNKLYEKILQRNTKNPSFVLHDGPPYANGNPHVGTALNKILKDIIVRYKSMQGFYSPYVPGWDTHGLPIENKMLKSFSKSQFDFSPLELRRKAQEYALEQIENQRKQFLRMQLLSDLKVYYKTCDPKYEATQLRIFQKMVKENLIFKTLKPVYWSPSSQTALAEAEVEYHVHTSPSLYIALPIMPNPKIVPLETQIIIWTTTPWTLLANAALAIGVNIEYALVEADQKLYICAKDRIGELTKLMKWATVQPLRKIDVSQLVQLTYMRPFSQLLGPIVFGHHVTTESGSGIVHVAPLFGTDDFIIGKKFGLEMIMHVDAQGTIKNSTLTNVNDHFYLDANKEIVVELTRREQLLSASFIKHQFPYDWRTNKPIMYRGTDQWFISIEKIKKPIVKCLENVNFTPDWAKKRITKMIEDREDWCISRQRSWGVPITIFYNKEKQPIFDDEIFDYVIALVEKYGSNVWYERDTNELLPAKYRNLGFSKETDIMDVWFDSGSSNVFELGERIKAPYQLYLEGTDQYRGWFNSSLIISFAYRKEIPFTNLISHGFVVDEKNQKMSKSKGNVIDPMEIIDEQGADILRLWVANSDFINDISVSKRIIFQNGEYYRRIRNTFRFLLGNLYDFDAQKHAIPLEGVHLLINEKIEILYNEILQAYENYDFQKIIKNVNAFFVEMSGFYLEIAKDILYTKHPNNAERRMFQMNIYKMVDTILVALAPILPTTCEDIYSHFNKKNKHESVHLETFRKPFLITTQYVDEWRDFFKTKDQVYKLIENAKKDKIVARNNEISVTLNGASEFVKKLDLKKLLLVAEVQFGDQTVVTKFISEKCPRCWNHYKKDDFVGNICKECDQVIQELCDK